MPLEFFYQNITRTRRKKIFESYYFLSQAYKRAKVTPYVVEYCGILHSVNLYYKACKNVYTTLRPVSIPVKNITDNASIYNNKTKLTHLTHDCHCCHRQTHNVERPSLNCIADKHKNYLSMKHVAHIKHCT